MLRRGRNEAKHRPAGALTVQVAARQLQPQAQALGGGSLGVDPDEAGPHGGH